MCWEHGRPGGGKQGVICAGSTGGLEGGKQGVICAGSTGGLEGGKQGVICAGSTGGLEGGNKGLSVRRHGCVGSTCGLEGGNKGLSVLGARAAWRGKQGVICAEAWVCWEHVRPGGGKQGVICAEHGSVGSTRGNLFVLGAEHRQPGVGEQGAILCFGSTARWPAWKEQGLSVLCGSMEEDRPSPLLTLL